MSISRTIKMVFPQWAMRTGALRRVTVALGPVSLRKVGQMTYVMTTLTSIPFGAASSQLGGTGAV